MTRSLFPTLRRLGGPALVLAGVASLVGCSDSVASGPEAGRLSGVYGMSDMLYVFVDDTFAISDDSHLHLEFIDDEHVRGSGEIWIDVPVRNDEGELVADAQPLLWAQTDSGPGPVTFEGWYYIAEGEEADTLRFRFARGAGAGTFIEAFSWALDDSWGTFQGGVRVWPYRIRVTQSAR